MSKVYDQLMKSGRFTAAQTKAEKGEVLDSISELVAMCEQEGFIPRYYVESPKDKVDETIEDYKRYVHRLVVEEQNLGNLIETSLKAMMQEVNKQEDEDIDEEDEDILEVENSLTNNDYLELQNMIDEEMEEDNGII